MRKALATLLLVIACGLPAFAQDDSLSDKSKRAHLDMNAGRYREAAAIYRELVRALPAEPRLRLNLGLALIKSGQPAEAVPELQKATAGNAQLAPAWFLLGLAYAQLKRPADAIAPLRAAVRLDTANSEALLELADAELSAGDSLRASQDFSTLAAHHSEMPKAWQGLGVSYLALSEHALQNVKSKGPESGYWCSLQARTSAAEENVMSAQRLYRHCLSLDAQMPGLHGALAGLHRENGDMAEAEREEELETKVKKSACDTASSACLYLRNEWSEVIQKQALDPSVENSYWASLAGAELARQSFQHLAALPASSEMHDVLARLDEQSGKRLDAVAEWRKAVVLDPSNLHLQARLAKSLFRAREYPEAQHLFEKLVDTQPDNPDWLYFLGGTLLRQGQEADSLPYFEKVARLQPDSLPIQENLGRVYLKSGQIEKAIACLERALPIDDDGSISFALSTAYRKQGRTEDAQSALKRYREMQRTLR
jgi:tetratricopeptide (TPR) repeat protein